MQDSFEKFVEDINTKEQLASLLNEIEIAENYIYKGKQEEPLSKRLKGKISDTLLNKLSLTEIAGDLPFNLKDQAEFFKVLRESLSKLPILKLKIAFKPREEFVEKIGAYIKNQLKEKAIIELSVDEGVMGGAVVEFKGEYRDFSLGKALSQVLEKRNLSFE